MLRYVLTSLSTLLGTTTPGTPLLTGDYGIGISLSEGYGTVSAYFPNDNFIDIAKVEGGPGYKSYMHGSTEVTTSLDASPIYCPLPSHLCENWSMKRSHQNPLAPMLNALIAATKSALETPITTVAINIYDVGPIDRVVEERLIQTVLYPQGISDWEVVPEAVGRPIISAAGFIGKCSDPYLTPDEAGYYREPSRLILVLDYSRLALTASLWEEECGLSMLTSHYLHSRDLGYDGMQACMNNHSAIETCKNDFVAALESMLEGSRYASIGGVLTIGENAADQVMLAAVRRALEKEFKNGASVDLSLMKRFSPDLAFAGSRASAWAEWGVKDRLRKEKESEINVLNSDL